VQLLPYVTTGPGGASGGVLELALLGGLVLGDAAKWGLRRAWRRLAAPRGRHRAASSQ
jgi:hypothetical protein